jgi:tyrosine-protein kinase Etk/Wzc
LALLDPQDLAVEAIRSLRTSLQFALADSKNNVVLVSGPRPAVGKSFVLVNLAVLLADSGKRVLLVDADMRKGRLHTYFGMERVSGLSEVLAGTLDPTEATRATQHPNVAFISTGTLPPNPSELLLNARFGQFMAQASSGFDLVLVDAPPVLAVTDAAIMAHHAGVTLLVLRAGLHPLREIALTTARMQQNGVRPNGFIINDVTAHIGRYGKYGYHYQYEYK